MESLLSKTWKQVQKMFSKEEEYSRLNNLEKTFTSFCRTPLHIAVMSGDIKFATKILSKKPDLALKQDSKGFTPLHLASVRTSLPMVKLLLKANPRACILQDADWRTPLHVAAMKNRVEIIKVLMNEGLPEAIHLKNDKNGYQMGAYWKNFHSIFIDSTDKDNNTILHLAVKMGNIKITNYLLLNNSNIKVNINIENKEGLKALNMLPEGEKNDLEFGFYDYHVRREKNKSTTLSKNGDKSEGLKDRVNTLMVVATLIAGIAFQAAMNPPGGVWQEDAKVDSGTDPVTFVYYLEHMFASSLSGGLVKYIQDNLEYSNIRDFVYSLTGITDPKYAVMADKGLILEDLAFTSLVSDYNSSENSSSVFFPYLTRYAGHPILAYTYPESYVIYMVTNGVALFVSLAIIFLVICGFMIETSIIQVRILVVLMSISIVCIATGYLSIVVAMLPGFYSPVINVSIVLQVIIGVCCMLGVGYFIWSLTWKIVKLRKRTRQHHIGVINYLEALFFNMDAKDAGKIIILIVGYFAFRVIAFIYYDDWSHINPILY